MMLFHPVVVGRGSKVSNEVQTDLAGLQNALLKTDSVEQFLRELAVLAVPAGRRRRPEQRDQRIRDHLHHSNSCGDDEQSDQEHLEYRR